MKCGMGSRSLSVRLNPRLRKIISETPAAKETYEHSKCSMNVMLVISKEGLLFTSL
jgi:hypothetical protein